MQHLAVVIKGSAGLIQPVSQVIKALGADGQGAQKQSFQYTGQLAFLDAMKPSILWVEDDETHLRLRKAVLEKAGYLVLGAASVSEALEILSEAPVCLVLSDYMLRETTGTELAKEMKKIKPDVPIVLYSGTVPETLEYVDAFISKGESVSCFLMLIREFVWRYFE